MTKLKRGFRYKCNNLWREFATYDEAKRDRDRMAYEFSGRRRLPMTTIEEFNKSKGEQVWPVEAGR